MKQLNVLLAVGLLAAAPAEASTVPAIDRPGVILAVGLTDMSLDVPLMGGWSVGATGIYTWPMPGLVSSAAVRTNWRLAGGAKQPSIGLTVAAGFSAYIYTPESYWVQPAIVAALPIGGSGFTLRGTLGPLFREYTYVQGNTQTASKREVIPLWPNLELAYAFGSGQELTLGGNSLLGWRASF